VVVLVGGILVAVEGIGVGVRVGGTDVLVARTCVAVGRFSIDSAILHPEKKVRIRTLVKTSFVQPDIIYSLKQS
jgi:hypothetical protein